MAKYIIHGGHKLSGKVVISGAKNAALKLLPAAILGSSPCIIHNVPRIVDIEKMEKIISALGAKVEVEGNTVKIDPTTIDKTTLDQDLTRKLRGSIVLAGPMLAKFGKVSFPQPGGCLIGARPIDSHLDVLSQFGVSVKEDKESYTLSGKPKSGEIVLSELSVTATENAIMASVLSRGNTIIHVAAVEPEIADLIESLNKMGAKITGANTHEIHITGVEKLYGTEHRVMPDRLEAGTYLMMAIATNSEIEICDVIPANLNIVLKILKSDGAIFDIEENGSTICIKTKKHNGLKPFYVGSKAYNVDTRTYPGFPTDLQSVYAVLATQMVGKTRIFETIFESRFGYIEEIKKMGDQIEIENPHVINITGPTKLTGTKIVSSDIRGGAALVLAGLIAKGTTEIDGIELIERGYENMHGKLSALGARIERHG